MNGGRGNESRGQPEEGVGWLNDDKFLTWCKRLGLGDTTCETVSKVRSRGPTRRVGGGRSNVSGRYLFAFLMWLLSKATKDVGLGPLIVVFAAVVFAVVHLAQPGVSWLQLACITATGTLYGWSRRRSGATAPATISHAVYNLVLYAISGAVLLGEKALPSR